MKSIKVTIMDKSYPLKVEESEIDNMLEVAKFVDERFKQYQQQLAKQTDGTIMTLAALSIATELFEQKKLNQATEATEELILSRVNKSLEKLLDNIQEDNNRTK